MDRIEFLKMHGLGNDFVLIDARTAEVPLDRDAIRHIADRRFGVGCDQVLRLEPSLAGDVFMRIWNADGSEARACGNGARCVARHVMAGNRAGALAVETVGGVLRCRDTGAGVAVDMGRPGTGWREIPLAREADTLALDLGAGRRHAVGVNMGNPHVVLFVADLRAVDLPNEGRRLERHPMLPEGANVSFVTVESPTRLAARVWERGAGVTPACGSAACAVVVAAVRRGLAERRATVALPGGELDIAWREDGRVEMAGPAAFVFRGTLERPRAA